MHRETYTAGAPSPRLAPPASPLPLPLIIIITQPKRAAPSPPAPWVHLHGKDSENRTPHSTFFHLSPFYLGFPVKLYGFMLFILVFQQRSGRAGGHRAPPRAPLYFSGGDRWGAPDLPRTNRAVTETRPLDVALRCEGWSTVDFKTGNSSPGGCHKPI